MSYLLRLLLFYLFIYLFIYFWWGYIKRVLDKANKNTLKKKNTPFVLVWYWCEYVCIYVCVCMCIYICVCLCIYACVCMCIYVCVCVCLQSQLEQLDYDDSRVEQLEAEQRNLNHNIVELQEKVDRLESRWGREGVSQSIHTSFIFFFVCVTCSTSFSCCIY